MQTQSRSNVEVMLPDGEVEFRGSVIGVSEIRFADEIAINPYLSELLPKISDKIDNDVAGVIDVMLSDFDSVRDFLFITTGVSIVDADLSTEEGELLMLKAWSVNSDFFARRVGLRRKLAGGATR